VVCLAPRAPWDSVRQRRLSGVLVRPLNFTVRPQMTASVRWAHASDALSLTAIRIATSAPMAGLTEGAPQISPLGQDYFARLIEQHPGLVYVAESRGVVVGYLALHHAAHLGVSARCPIQLWQLYVMPTFHGSGAADQLMSAAMHHAHTHQHDVIWLGVSEHNQRAMAFYRKQGFAAVGLFEIGSADHAHQDVVMSCSVH
jgi:ribosomal protein S18 acetylase RimI-like enzyme